MDVACWLEAVIYAMQPKGGYAAGAVFQNYRQIGSRACLKPRIKLKIIAGFAGISIPVYPLNVTATTKAASHSQEDFMPKFTSYVTKFQIFIMIKRRKYYSHLQIKAKINRYS